MDYFRLVSDVAVAGTFFYLGYCEGKGNPISSDNLRAGIAAVPLVLRAASALPLEERVRKGSLGEGQKYAISFSVGIGCYFLGSTLAKYM